MFSGNPGPVWGLVNTIQIIGFSPMMKIRLTETITGFLGGILSYNMTPNVFALLIEREGDPWN